MNLIEQAIAYSTSHEINWPRDPLENPAAWGVHQADPPPWNQLLGPVHARAGVSGMILRDGEVWQKWGDTNRADLTFSVAKTYLGLLAGVAHGRGLLPDPDEPIVRRLPGIGFDSVHNRRITWSHLMSQTSEWEGNCLGLPDQVEHYRYVAHDPRGTLGTKGSLRPLQAPGNYWEYNDVRINQLSLALLHLFGQALPEVFRESILRPIGATGPFSWEGYDNAWVDLPARPNRAACRIRSVPGGTHWGGGVSISTHDQALIGELIRRDGQWIAGGKAGGNATRVIPENWVRGMREPCALAPFYGWLTWLNPDGMTFPGASAESILMVGAGGNYVWLEPKYQAVIVVRWIEPARFSSFASQVTRALEESA
jgi:CubicO group peptidase (beta-lactamase class C family)